MASHHHTAAIALRQMRRSASGVRKEIGPILQAGSSISLSARLCQEQDRRNHFRLRLAALPQGDKVGGFVGKFPNGPSWVRSSSFAALGTYLDGIKRVCEWAES